MALVWIDGFDEINPTTGDEGLLNSSGYQGAQGFESTTATRTGNGVALRLSENTLSAAVGTITKVVAGRDEYILGFGFRNDGFIRFREFLFFAFDNFNGTVRDHLKIAVNDSAGITVRRGEDNAFLGSTESNAISQDVWHYMEVRVKISATAGEVEIRIDECTKLQLTGVNTQHSGAGTNINHITFTSSGGSFIGRGVSLDDLYIIDKDPGEYTDFLGDVAVATLFPNAPGDDSDFTVVNETANYLAVDDVGGSDGNATYVVSSTVGHKDLYNLDDLPANILEVKAVQITGRVRKEGAGGAQFRLVLKNGATEAFGPDQFTTTQFKTFHEVFELDATGANWSIAAGDAAQIGVEVR